MKVNEMTNAPVPIVMHPAFSPKAAMVSAATLVVSVAMTILALPNGFLSQVFPHLPAVDVTYILMTCNAVTLLAAGHLSMARSLLPAVDKSA
jgi:hypothetical protein